MEECHLVLSELRKGQGDKEATRAHLRRVVHDCILSDPVACSKSDLEESVLWRYCYYKCIEAFRKSISRLRVGDPKAKVDLIEVTGRFLHFLDQSKSQYLSLLQRLSEVPASQYRCNLYLGDLCRYRELYDDSKVAKSYQVASDYYLKALDFDMSQGTPHNQLAVVSQYLGKTCIAMYRYIRSLYAEHPFPTSGKNLDMLFRMVKLPLEGPLVVNTSSQRNALLRDFLSRFVYLQSVVIGGGDAASIIDRICTELPLLVKKSALSRDLYVALIVGIIHSSLVGDDEAGFVIVTLLVDMYVETRHNNLLVPIALYLEWLHRNAFRLESGKDYFWDSLKRAMPLLQGSCSNDVFLWEDAELLGFSPFPWLTRKNVVEDLDEERAGRILRFFKHHFPENVPENEEEEEVILLAPGSRFEFAWLNDAPASPQHTQYELPSLAEFSDPPPFASYHLEEKFPKDLFGSPFQKEEAPIMQFTLDTRLVSPSDFLPPKRDASSKPPGYEFRQ